MDKFLNADAGFSREDIREALKLYVIPDRKIGAPLSLAEQARLAAENGATMIQLRDKEMGGGELLEVARAMKVICLRYGLPLIVNDRLDVALAAGADGVHLGRSDLPVAEARRLVPSSFLIGASVRTKKEALAAEKDGADYLGAGAIFPTGSKDDADVIGLERLRSLVGATSLPVVAIGGITRGNLPEVMTYGVDGVSVISAALRGDVAAKTSELRRILDRFA